ncbi:MAG: hypothetical protein HFE51_10435 [Clostridia bacterium]|nr:hypothetical protein [Clostridia bacterium]MCI8956303.1 hypothetical protein [Eubacterium sp.]MCI9086812.1 hypothetical protein [Clostridia bacterium]
MQRVLSFTANKKKYISKPWDFEAMCRVQEIHIKQETNSIGRICGNAVDYLFEGTQATQDIIDASPADKMRMCREVWAWYLEDMTAKNEEAVKAAIQEEVTAEN